MAKDFYAVLGVARQATPEQIRERFRELVRSRHPDRFPGADKASAEVEFQAITEAFNVLSDPERRRQHDLESERPEPLSAGREGERLARFHLNAGVKSYRERRYSQAAESFDRATKADPTNAQAWHHLAQACSHQRRYLAQALQAIVKACELEPMNAAYAKLAGRLHGEAGLVDRADWYYNQALLWGGEDPAVQRAIEQLRKAPRRPSGGLFGKVG